MPIKQVFLKYKEFSRNCVKHWMFRLHGAYQHSSQRCKGQKFAKRDQKGNMLCKSMDEYVENMDDHGCHKLRKLFDPKADGELWIRSRYPS